MNYQENYELQVRDESQRRYDKKVDKAISKDYYSSTDAGRHTIHVTIKEFGDRMLEVCDQQSTKLASRKNLKQAYRIINRVIEAFKSQDLTEEDIDTSEVNRGAYRLSVFALKTILDSYSRNKEANITVAAMACKIGELVNSEMELIYYYGEMPENIAKRGKRKARDPDANPKNRRYNPIKLMKNLATRERISYEGYGGLTPSEQSQVGMFFIELGTMIGLLDTKNVIVGKTKQQKFLFADELIERLNDLETNYRFRAFDDVPLKLKPLPWEYESSPSRINTSGGGHSKFVRHRHKLCRGYYTDTVFKHEAIDLLNKLQDTAWMVDNQVLTIARQCLEKGYTVGSFQSMVDKPEPLVPIPGLSDEEVLKRKGAKAVEHRAANNANKKYLRTARVLETVKEYQYDGEFYYSWSCDWRGRIYPIASWLQIQGPDYERALLQFRQGCELNKVGKQWAARAVGGAYLGSTSSYDDRENWTYQNEELIKLIASDPISNIGLWDGAKEPWSFLQLALEWSAVVLFETKSTWHVPVGVDSTASGLQLLSAMRRDKQGMRFANLLPSNDSTKPQDAYMRVLELAKEQAVTNHQRHLLDYLDYRNVGKPALMLSIYGGSFKTILARILEFFDDKKIEISYDDCKAVTSLVLAASKKTFPEAYKALSWLKKLARIAFEDLEMDRLSWSTPTGDYIDLTQNELAMMKIHTELLGTVNVALGETEEPDTKSMTSSFAPSFVHSYDAALVKAAFHDWEQPIALIHDCVRLLPNDMNQAISKIKIGFTKVCNGDPLSQLADDLGVDAEMLPRLPQGDDNLLGQVMNSTYMFN